MNGKTLMALAPLLILALPACTPGVFGSLKTSDKLAQAYAERALPEDLQYYYSGRANLPEAVVGIQRAYAFDDRFWHPLESREDLYQKIGNMARMEPDHRERYFRQILGPDKTPVGIYISFYHATTVRVVQGRVSVVNPYKPGSNQSEAP